MQLLIYSSRHVEFNDRYPNLDPVHTKNISKCLYINNLLEFHSNKNALLSDECGATKCSPSVMKITMGAELLPQRSINE